MKNRKRLLGGLVAVSGTVGILGKGTATKVTGFAVAGIGAAFLLRELFKEEKKVIEAQCEEAEQIIEDAGVVDVSEVDEIDLSESEEYFGKTLLKFAYENSKFEDEVLNPDVEDFLGTVHVLEDVDRKKIIIGIPLPIKNRKGMNPKDLRDYFVTFYRDFVIKQGLEVPLTDDEKNAPYLNQKGYWVGENEDGIIDYGEIEMKETETFGEYLNKITDTIYKWHYGSEAEQERLRTLKADKGFETIGFEQYLEIELPVFPKRTGRKGMDLLLTMALLNKLMDCHDIHVKNNGHHEEFRFKHIMFHEADDYATFFRLDGKQITRANLCGKKIMN